MGEGPPPATGSSAPSLRQGIKLAERQNLQGRYCTPTHRKRAVREALDALQGSRRAILTTHLNADGDGVGCQAALVAWMRALGGHPHIVNPTAFPDLFRGSSSSCIQQTSAICNKSSHRTVSKSDTFGGRGGAGKGRGWALSEEASIRTAEANRLASNEIGENSPPPGERGAAH